MDVAAFETQVQDRSSQAWKVLCDYVDRIADEGAEVFDPYQVLGPDLYGDIYTLPESISKLTKVKRVHLYGSNLNMIPPEIGQMESLRYLDLYRSYRLHWAPFEITQCKGLKDSRVSTRALYGNLSKNQMGFPSLSQAPVKYLGERLNCSMCKKEISYAETKQMWITSWVGSDHLPLLTNLCSLACENRLHEYPKPIEIFWQYPHQGGKELAMPTVTPSEWMASMRDAIMKFDGFGMDFFHELYAKRKRKDTQ